MRSPDRGAAQQKAVVAILTTGGPAIVRAFAFDGAAARSEIVRFDRNWEPLAINAGFGAFNERLSEALRRIGFDIPESPLLVELDADVDTGDSWHAGVAAAHILHAGGALALGLDEADIVICATGRLGSAGWRFLPVAAVAEKAEAASALLGRPGARYLAPLCQADEVAGVEGVEDLAALARKLGATADPSPLEGDGSELGGTVSTPAPKPGGRRTRRPDFLAFLILAGVAVAAAIGIQIGGETGESSRFGSGTDVADAGSERDEDVDDSGAESGREPAEPIGAAPADPPPREVWYGIDGLTGAGLCEPAAPMREWRPIGPRVTTAMTARERRSTCAVRVTLHPELADRGGVLRVAARSFAGDALTVDQRRAGEAIIALPASGDVILSVSLSAADEAFAALAVGSEEFIRIAR